MRKIIFGGLLLAATLIPGWRLQAQTAPEPLTGYHYAISLQGGGPSYQYIKAARAYNHVMGGGAHYFSTSGAYALNLHYYPGFKGVDVWGSLLYERVSQRIVSNPADYGDFTSPPVTSHVHNSYYGVLLGAHILWGQAKKVTFYSGGGLGLSLKTKGTIKNAHSSTLFNYQATAVGIRFGGKLAGFAELGYGAKGVLSGGIAYRW